MTTPANTSDRFTIPRELNGHHFEHDQFGRCVRCRNCKAFITDYQIVDGDGSLQEAAERLLNALGQVNRVRGRLAGEWKVEA